MQRGHWHMASAFCVALAGCSSATLPTLPLPSLSAAYQQPPSEIYARIARGALGCWFAASGPLKRTHIFHADVAPPSDNAGAEIVIHERDNTTGQNPRAIRAYRIAITRAPEGTFVASENLKLPAALATRMEGDINRWAKGQAGCNTPGTETWQALETKADSIPTGALPAVIVSPQTR
jgi:hypothetical protein